MSTKAPQLLIGEHNTPVLKALEISRQLESCILTAGAVECSVHRGLRILAIIESLGTLLLDMCIIASDRIMNTPNGADDNSIILDSHKHISSKIKKFAADQEDRLAFQPFITDSTLKKIVTAIFTIPQMYIDGALQLSSLIVMGS